MGKTQRVIWKKGMIIILALFIWFSFQPVYAQVDFVRTYKIYGEGEQGKPFTVGKKQCVDFVKQNRLDIQEIPYTSARDMELQLKEKGFEVNSVPRVGAILVLPNAESKDPETGELKVDGHAAVVQEVARRQDGKYELVIMDAHFDKPNTIGKAKYIYNPNEGKVEELNYEGEGGKNIKVEKLPQERRHQYSEAKFIHENTVVITTFRQAIGREPSVGELSEYSRKILSGENIRQELFESQKYAKERQEYRGRLKEEIRKSQEEANKSIVKRVLEATVQETKERLDQTWNRLFGIKTVDAATSIKPSSDASQLAQRTAQQQLTPVKVEFTQTFNGLYTQTPISPGSQSANFSGSITSGTRIGEGSRPGNYTGSFNGSLTAYPGDIPGTYNNSPFNAWSVGTVEAKGFKEGTLKGTMNITGTLGGATYTYPKGPVTINTDGSLSHTFSGDGVLKRNGVDWGTVNGTLTQSKTTP